MAAIFIPPAAYAPCVCDARPLLDNIDSRGVDTAVAKNVGELGNVLFNTVKRACKKVTQIVRKDLVWTDVCLFTKAFHLPPDVCPADRLACTGNKDRSCCKFCHTTMGASTVAKYLNSHGYIKKQRQNGTLSSFSAHFVKLVLDNPVYCGKISYGRRKTEKVNGERNQYHIVRQTDFPIYDGIHEAIISEDEWRLAQEKRKRTGVKNKKVYSMEHQHILSGIVCCPGCGHPMYGSVNRKRKKDGTFYRDYWYYACKHYLDEDGHKCTYSKQIHQEKINAAVEEVIRNIIHDPKFEEATKAKIQERIDTAEIEAEIKVQQKKSRQMVAAKDKLMRQMDSMDYSDPCYDQKYEDLQKRLDALYLSIREIDREIDGLQEKMDIIRRNQISQQKVYEFLLLFDIIYEKMTDAEKKEFICLFINNPLIFMLIRFASKNHFIKVFWTINVMYYSYTLSTSRIKTVWKH